MTTTTDITDLTAELRDVVRRTADEAERDDRNASTLDVERYLRLAEYALAQAHHHATTDEETSEPMFSFLYCALALLEPDGGTQYNSQAEYSSLAFDAVIAIAGFSKP